MKIVTNNLAAHYGYLGTSHSRFPESVMLAKIGDELRDFYADVTASAQPDDLVRLAHRIDARRVDDGSEV